MKYLKKKATKQHIEDRDRDRRKDHHRREKRDKKLAEREVSGGISLR